MNERWNLDPIYQGFDDPNFEADLNTFQARCQELEQLTQNLEAMEPMDALRQSIELQERLVSVGYRLAGYASLRQSAETKNTQASSAMGRVMAVFSTTAGPTARFERFAAKLPNLMELVERDELLRQYRFYFRRIQETSRYILPGEGESIMARMHLSGSSAWSDLQSYLTSSVEVDYQGGKTNLSAIRNLAYDPDQAVRKAAFEAELACYDKIKDPVAFALNSIKLETISDTKLRGYTSPLEQTLIGSRMQRATLDAMFSAIDEYLPKFWAYLRAKGNALGHENGLPWYDLFAPMGKSSKVFTTEDARDYLLALFAKFDPELHDMVQRAFDEAWIDFYPRDGKTGGAFCSNVECLNESRILTNFDGSFSDVVTLAHELGHAFHNHQTRSHRILNRDYSMPVAETASTFNECVIMNAAIAAASDRDEKLALIESQLSDATQIICDIYSRYRFESEVFARRESEFLNADALCDIMLRAQKASYGDGLDHNCLHPYMWVCKSHYYGGVSFYNFPYAFGGLFARGLYAQYEKEGEAFLPKYKKLLHETTVSTVEETAQVAGIDLTDREFWKQGLQVLADEIDLFLATLKEA